MTDYKCSMRLVAALSIVGLSCLLGCSRQSSPPQNQQVPKVIVAKPLLKPIVEWDEYTGRLDAIDSVEIRARVSGYLQSVHFEEGRLVNAGDLLYIIDPRPFEAALNAANAGLAEADARLSESQSLLRQAESEQADAQAQLTLRDRQFDRASKLLAQRALAQEEVDIRESEQLQATAAFEAAKAQVESAKAGIATANASIETAKANVQAAQLNLEYTQIRAPISDRISRRYVTEGNLISGGSSQSTLLTTIVSIDPIHCYFDADEQAFLKYARLSREGKRESSRDVKNPVYMSLIDEAGFPHRGHMDFVDNRIDPNTGTMRGRAIFPNGDSGLTPGLFAKLRLPGSGRYEAVLIPDSAVGSDQSEKYVYVINDEQLVERKLIELGPLSEGLRIIRSGLEGDETLVIRGLQRVSPGAKVETAQEEIAADSDGDLPNNYEPVPKEKWLSRQPTAPPDGLSANEPSPPSRATRSNGPATPQATKN